MGHDVQVLQRDVRALHMDLLRQFHLQQVRVAVGCDEASACCSAVNDAQF